MGSIFLVAGLKEDDGVMMALEALHVSASMQTEFASKALRSQRRKIEWTCAETPVLGLRIPVACRHADPAEAALCDEQFHTLSSLQIVQVIDMYVC